MKKNYKWRSSAFMKKLTGLIAVVMFVGLSGVVQAQTTDCFINNQQGGIAAGTLSLFSIADNGISTLFDPSGSGDFGDPGCFLDAPYTYLIANVVIVMGDASVFGIADEGLGTLEYKVTIESVVDDTCSILGAAVWTSTTLTEVMNDEGIHVITVPVNYVTSERVFVSVKTVSWSGSLTRSPSVLLWDNVPRSACRQFVHSDAGATVTAFENFFNGGETGWTTIGVEGAYDTPTGDVDFAVDSISAPDSAWVEVVTVPVKAYIKNMGDFNMQNAKFLLKENGTAVDSMLVNLANDSSKMITFNYAPTTSGDNTVMVMAMVDGDVDNGNDSKSTTIYGKDYNPPCEGETIICDGFDLYTVGPINGQGSWWSTWSGQLGGAEDGIVTTDQALSAPNSMFIDSTGTQDVLLLLGNKDAGSYSLEFSVYIPAGRGGYYNIQDDETPGLQWDLEVYFNNGGSEPGVGSFAAFSDSTFTYPEDEWFSVKQVIDVDAELMSFWVNGTPVFEKIAYAPDGKIGAVDFFSSSNNNKMYIDDVNFDDADPLSACDFPTIICDNFDTYTLGALASQSAHWSTWSGAEGGPEDGIVDSTYYNSPTNSMFIDSTGSQDVLLLLGNKEDGSYSLDFNVYIPAGRGGYYNIQDDETPGIQWDLEVYFNNGGSAPGVGSFAAFSDSTFTYPEDEWFNVKQVVDLDAELMSFWVNGTPVFQKIAYAVDGKIGSIDFFSASTNNKMYVDDVIFDEADPLSACDFPTIICDNIDDYTTGAIGPQAAWWSTWSGDLGGPEDGIVVDTVFNSAPNSMYVGNGGAQDVLLLLGNKETGSYSIDFNAMVPEDAEGYFNVQNDEVAGQQWNLEVWFNLDGAAPGVGSFAATNPDSTFSYPVGEWFPIHMVIDLDANLMSFWADGNLVFEGYQYGPDPGSEDPEWKIGSLDIFSGSNINHFYMDDIVFDESEGLSACSFPTIICDNYDSYSTGALGSQAAWWSTWSGELGGPEDGIVTTDQVLSAPNSMFIDSTGTQDVLLLLGNKTVGIYVIELDIYIPAGSTGYYNIQNEETPGIQWNLNVFFNLDGAAPGVGSFSTTNGEPGLTFDYPEDEWFHINMGINLNTNNMAFTVNGVVVFSDFAYGGNLGSLDFFSSDNMNHMYVDNVVFFGDDIVSVQELTKLGEFKLYPNPNDGNFTITSAELSGAFMVEMIDMSGRIVYSEQINLDKNENKQINTNDLNNGVYILRMVNKSTNETYTTRVSIQ
jgi:hypothetical protein